MMDRRKENQEKAKTSVVTAILTTIGIIMVFIVFLFWKDMNTMTNAYSDMKSIEFLSSSTQRAISMAQSNELQKKDLFFISDATYKTLTIDGSETLSTIEDPSVAVSAQEIVDSWDSIEVLLTEYLETGDNKLLLNLTLAREKHFNGMTTVVNEIDEICADLSKHIKFYQLVMLTLAVSMGICLLVSLLNAQTVLKYSKELAINAQIDTSTGLYNRSRCQDLFRNDDSTLEYKKRAMLVTDLNDLKKTNDTLGHRVGDELIHSFADILKNASKIHNVPPFIGRYGGDEFIVFYENIKDEKEVLRYIDELDYYAKEFNEKSNSFKISYAVGYSLIADETEQSITNKDLFDKADESMYKNKLEKKRAANPNYDEEIEKGAVR